MIKEIPTKPGVYFILNLFNGKHYVGSTKNLRKRQVEHFYDLGVARHSNRKLQNAWNVYGVEQFRFDVIEVFEELDKAVLLESEQFWIDSTNPFYNIARKAKSRLGIKASDETRRRISEAKLNMPQEIKDRLAEGNRERAKERRPETIRKMSESARTRPPISEETRQLVAEAGRNHSEEARRKQGDAWRGKQHSDESIEKMRLVALGRVISESQRQKLREANLGKKHTEETLAKMRTAHAKRRDEKLAAITTKDEKQ